MSSRSIIFIRLLAVIVFSCTGTSTGNPADSNGSVPEGIELAMSNKPREPTPDLTQEEQDTLAKGNSKFAFDLYAALAQGEDNLFFSPYSISIALAMIYAGAEGNTEAEMRSTLHFELPEPVLHQAFNYLDLQLRNRINEIAVSNNPSMDPLVPRNGFQLEVINQAWCDKDERFLDAYLDILAINYGAGLFLVDFSDTEKTRGLINAWVMKQTQERVEELLSPDSIDGFTRLVVTNTIYFKADWLSQFNPEYTRNDVFHAPSIDVTVPMMHKTTDSNYVETEDYQAIEIPYLSSAVRMLLILPVEDRFQPIQSNLDETFMEELLSNLKEYETELTLPHFDFEYEIALTDILMSLGMRDAFTSQFADFSGITGTISESDANLFIKQVHHKTFVAVDEYGTEAAAATYAEMRPSLGPEEEPKTIIFNRPFIFFIYDQPTRHLLFVGRVMNPN